MIILDTNVVSEPMKRNANLSVTAAEQKKQIEGSGKRAIFSYNQTDFVKDRIAVEVQFGKYSFVA